MEKPSRRESALMVVACLVAIGMGYSQFRYRPAIEAVKKLEEDVVSSAAELKGITFPKEPLRSPAVLKSDLSKLAIELKTARAHLEVLEKRFVSTDAPEKLQGLKVEVSGLARRSRVRIKSSLPYDINKRGELNAGGKFFSQIALGVPYRRPLQELRIESSYKQLRRFIRGLDHLSFQASVVWFDIVVSGQTLSTTLILAL